MDIEAMWKTAMRPTLVAVTFLALMPVHGTVHADQQTEPTAAAGGEQKAEPRSPRLKFRSRGPACMCLSGLSEADIQAAQSRREDGTEKLESIIRDQ
ncbi:hypothetical protein TspCOW1_27200 [Thiohalobacter sp. COW1]|uniref:Uncharacterized protein n=1 Tax=Thiohalobacter thiocyanaticus TaxID=585455 RepID=A0A1Z4VM10_9GAMM|nr:MULTISPECIES: hypothetical protein [Thiohalobacter]BAZ92408.1 uncharacterized protein FOKN1_0003 [Thiohalobacter thiocyanaticus]BCO32617.1 hypothetical protein TspCOW1_27200 [Thiohalobacter sp. COW1]